MSKKANKKPRKPARAKAKGKIAIRKSTPRLKPDEARIRMTVKVSGETLKFNERGKADDVQGKFEKFLSEVSEKLHAAEGEGEPPDVDEGEIDSNTDNDDEP